MNLLRKLISVRIYIVSFLEALIAVACFTAAVFINRTVDAPFFFEFEGGALSVAVLAFLTLVISYLLDFYRRSDIKSPLLVVLDAGQLMGMLLLANAALAFVDFELLLQQIEILLGSGLLLIALICWRLIARPALWSAFGAQSVLFVGWSPTTNDIVAELQANPARGLEMCGYVVEPGQNPPGKTLGSTDRLAEVLGSVSPDRIVVDSTITNPSVLMHLLETASAGTPVQTSSQMYEWMFSRVDCRGLHPYTVLFLEDLKGRPASLAVQSVYTNLLALVAIVVAAPVILLIAVTLRLGRRGPVFAMHECVGLHGIPLNLYQFHCTDEDKSIFGRLLRRFKLYGLPQIVNLVRGELSLLGPRPEKSEFDTVLNELIPYYRQRQVVRPGIFGWSQLHCDPLKEESTRLRLEYDLYYIKNVSVSLDIYIMLRALRSILSGEHTGVTSPAAKIAATDTGVHAGAS
jgi:lipopolysaccharide/colanic/teichoic acid biosynthesis glycosyltransferase